MIDKLTVEQCCLCRACSDKCPVSAIRFEKEYNGFHYPVIDQNACISCNACEAVCPVLTERSTPEEGYPKAYAARSREVEVRMQSTSGGIFYEAARKVLSEDGYVCGTVLDEQFQVKQIVSNNIQDIDRMRGSKYAQSDTTGCFRQIQELLKQHKQVLFCGCPCQAAALRAYLKRDYENLLIIDFVCHGIPSQQMLDSYLDVMSEKYRSRPKTVQFRSKVKGWHNSSVRICFENGRVYTNPITVDPYMLAFLSGTSMKERCYSCPFKNFSSGSDLTLGDFWGAEAVMPEIDDNTGTSAMFVNSSRGAQFVSGLPVELADADPETVIRYNRNIRVPSEKNPLRQPFLELAAQSGFGYAIKTLFTEPIPRLLRRKASFCVRSIRYYITGKNKPLY